MNQAGGGAFTFGARDPDDLITELPYEQVGLGSEYNI